uniref:Nucleolar protein 6 n=1 Tax=Suricata suricatta TaxID=37032 RepID=A0A673VC95_SURSU
MGPAPAGVQHRGAAGESEVMELALEDTCKEGKKESSKKCTLAGSPVDGLLQPVKLSQAELYKEPTNEELNRLRETESLFHSSLLRLQVEELLKEVRLPEKKKARIDAFLREVHQRVLKVPSTPKTELTDQTWLPAGVRVPLHQVPYTVKGSFCFLPPAQVTVVGSYLLGTCVRPDINVDMAVTMPREILQDKDGLNQRYFRKRALYLAHLAHHLGQDPLFGSVHFSYTNGCHLKPSLLLRPHGKNERLVTVRLHPCPPPDFFRPCRLLPSKNNVRSAWYRGQSPPGDGSPEPPTPHYNTWVLQDMTLESHVQLLSTVLGSASGLKDGVALLKVWLRQRELDKGLGGFSGFLVSMLVAFLVSTRKIHTTMSGYQVLRSGLQFLATTDLTVNGISLCLSSDPSLPALADFHQAFSVVFLDSSGYLNLCADVTASTYHQWDISQDPPKHRDSGTLTLGLLLRPEGLTSVLELGPEANQPEAAEFRQFWGSRSELRRFQDGAIREAVVWEAASMAQKRLIPHQVVTHLLALHADIPDTCVHYVGGLLDALIQSPKETSSTGEEALAAAVRCYDDLSRLLWGLEGLPLTVSAVQGAHPVLRYTEVFPPTPVRPAYSFHEHSRERASLLPRPDKPCPAYVEPMTVVCHLEGSGQWPQDAEAIRRVRAAFQLRLAELLTQQHGLQCRATAMHTDVLKDGFVFRIRVAYQREPQILREMRSPEGMISLRDTPASLRLERDTRQLPLLTSALHGLQQQHPAFSGVARLAKRWVRAQLLDEGLTDESLDLVVAALFLHPEPFTPPSSPQVGFLRFLLLISTFDWKNNPLIVNLNSELTVEEQVEIRSGFLATRTQLPVMVILTPQDRKNSVWTQDGPSPQILQQLVVLAAEALPVLEKQLMDPRGPGDIRTVFRPPLDMYDVLIRLSPRHIPRHRQAVDSPAASFCRGLLSKPGPSSLMPVLGYDPPQLYLAQLREAFGDLALFFYDQHGGDVIGVLWKPTSFQPQPFKASNTKGHMVVSQGGELVMVPNVEAILEDFAILGEGLVQSVEARSERWTV